MSPTIWTPDALRSEAKPFYAMAWRFVETQYRVSTLKLVDSLAEQATLEDILEATKPLIPAECRHLDYLLSTPFRYRPYPSGSRFRRAGLTQGVWYGAERPETAAAEIIFYRYLFYAESPETPFPDNAGEYTAFSAEVATPVSLDLMAGALVGNRQAWTHLTDYAACQGLADAAREIGTGIIRYMSVRDRENGANLAILSCRAFGRPAPVERRTWRIRIGPSGAQALCEHPRIGIEYGADEFAPDPRLAAMRWNRPSGR
jgi:RES domain